MKIFILHDAARRLFHSALGHLWGGALTSVPDENTRADYRAWLSRKRKNAAYMCRLKALVQAAQLAVIGEAGTYLASWPAGLGTEHR